MSGFSRVQTRELTNAPCLYGVTNGTAGANKAVVLDANKDITGIRNLTITGTLVAPTQAVTDSTWSVTDDGDATKVIKFQASGITTAKTLTLAGANTLDATITFPAATGTLATLAGTEALTGKTINGLTVGTSTGTLNITNGTTITGPAATGTLATLAGTETLSGKTLTDPIMTNIKRCTAQVDSTGTTLANITGLSTTVAIGVYRFKCHIPTTCGGTGGVKLAFNYTTTVLSAIDAKAYLYTAAAIATAGTTTTTTQTSIISSATAATSVIIEGTMTVSTGGTVDLQFAENNANSTSSVLVGATMEFVRIS